jgi:hypothetical protein
MVIKNAEFGADFEAVKKVAKKLMKKLSMKANFYFCVQRFSSCNFLLVNYFYTFSNRFTLSIEFSVL